MKELPNRLREFREGAGLSLQALAAVTDKAYQTISEYERGLQEMPEEFLMKAAKVLKKTTEEILERPERGGLILQDAPASPSNAATLRMMELERREFIAAVAWLVQRDKDRDALLISVRRSDLNAAAKNIIHSAINAADENDKSREAVTN